ncbi:unnamed protein product [Prorocentrum cordatum]|uniref:Uncharacterized protein n=1 Tax=Prorocentrum cordatum TaxID=2364126 RepID=A0ABN9V8J2_9DINO|nr:unnamed protein product [Polarella glacialis]
MRREDPELCVALLLSATSSREMLRRRHVLHRFEPGPVEIIDGVRRKFTTTFCSRDLDRGGGEGSIRIRSWPPSATVCASVLLTIAPGSWSVPRTSSTGLGRHWSESEQRVNLASCRCSTIFSTT